MAATTGRVALSDDELQLELTVPEEHQRSAARALGLDPLQGPVVPAELPKTRTALEFFSNQPRA